MRPLRALLVPACLIAFALVGCGNLNPSGSGTGTSIRVANLVPGPTLVTVTASGNTYLKAAPFETITGYQDITAGVYTFNVLLGTSTTPALALPGALANVSAYTFVPFGPTSGVGGLLLPDTFLNNIAGGNFAFRLASVSPTAGLIDAYLTAPGADLAALSPIASGIAYGASSVFISVPLGNYELRLTRAGTKEVIFDAPAPTAAEGAGQTVVAYSRGSGKLVNVALLVTNGGGQLVNNALAQFKVLNASSVPSPLNVFVDGGLTLANVPYTGVSSYQTTLAGTRNITVEAAATPGATLLTTSPALGPATDTSIALTGSAGSLAALVLSDFNVSTITGQAQVRFVNVSPDLGAVDVYANQTLKASGVAKNSASAYVGLDAATAGTAYQFDFDIAGTTTVALTLPSVTLTTGGVYTIYVVGPAAALQGVVSQDF